MVWFFYLFIYGLSIPKYVSKDVNVSKDATYSRQNFQDYPEW